MRHLQLLFVLLATVVTAYGQQDTVRKYLDAELRLTTKKKAAYNALAIHIGSQWALVAVRPDTTLMLKIFFKDAGLTIKDGYYAIYYPGGQIEEEGFFIGNVADGPWKSWYRNGQLQDSGLVAGNHFTGRWKHWHENGQLSMIHEFSLHPVPAVPPSVQGHTNPSVLSFITVNGISNGLYQSWYDNGAQESTGIYQNDTLVGVWKWFRENGKPSTVETYAGGKLTNLECYDENGVYSGATCSISKPAVFTSGLLDEKQYLGRELSKLRSLDWKREDVTVKFTITKKGTVANIILKSIDIQEYSHAVLRVFAFMPLWSPAISHNRIVDYTMEVFIPRNQKW